MTGSLCSCQVMQYDLGNMAEGKASCNISADSILTAVQSYDKTVKAACKRHLQASSFCSVHFGREFENSSCP